MGNSIEKPANYKVFFGDMEYDEEKGKFECPPTTLNNIKKLPQKGKEMPEGEMSIILEEYLGIREDDGKKAARINKKSLKIMASKEMIEEEAEKATKKYMQENGIKSVKELIEQVPEMPKITGNYEGKIDNNGEIVRSASGSER